MNKHTYIIIMVLLVISAVMFSSCSDKTGGETNWQAESVLRIGTDATYPPFEMVNTDSSQ